MPRPDDYADFATDTNFTNGPDVGTPTKVEPSGGELAEGNIRGTAPTAQKFNWWMNIVGKWIRHLADDVPDVQVFTANGTWNKPAWAKQVRFLVVGSGAGGSGISGIAGGGGGGGGEVVERLLPASLVPASCTIVVPTGGAAYTDGSDASVTGTGISITAKGGKAPPNNADGGDGGGNGGGTGGVGVVGASGWAGGGGGGGAAAGPLNGGAGYSGPGGVSPVGGGGGLGGPGYGGGGGGTGNTGAAAGGGGGGSFGVGPVSGATGGITTPGAGAQGVVIVISS